MAITAPPKKPLNTIRRFNILIKATTMLKCEWQQIIGRLGWIAIINKSLLGCIERGFTSKSEDKSHVVQVKDVWKRYHRTFFPLVPMALINFNMRICMLVIAFDAFLVADAVTKNRVNNAFAHSIWIRAQATCRLSTLPQNYKMPIVKLLANAYPWKKLLCHQWLNDEHISGLEATAAVLVLEAAIRTGAHNERLIILTDSLVLLDAMQKARCSSPIIHVF